jgi:hypothetical protein
VTQEEIVIRGEISAFILSNEAVMQFLEEEKADILACIGNTLPDDSKQRNLLYFQHHGISSFIDRLMQHVEAAKAINEANEKAASGEPEDPEFDID